MFEKVVRRTLNTGTTTSCYFSSLHLSSAKVLAKVCYEFGQRAFIGKCNVSVGFQICDRAVLLQRPLPGTQRVRLC